IEFHNNGKLSYFMRSEWENDEEDSLEIWWNRFGEKLGTGMVIITPKKCCLSSLLLLFKSSQKVSKLSFSQS
ncbi:MAG: hypothetical protein QF443_03150, partial [Dehalococcoidia bacterium]|nr:hypothetical protein [Dehalococcoidia bacterium]